MAVKEVRFAGAAVRRTLETIARDLGFILSWEPSGARGAILRHPPLREGLLGQGSHENGAPILTSFLTGVARRGPGGDEQNGWRTRAIPELDAKRPSWPQSSRPLALVEWSIHQNQRVQDNPGGSLYLSPSWPLRTLSCACMLNHFSHVRLFVTLWTIAHQAPLSMGFSRQEYWSGLPCPPPGKPKTLVSPALTAGFFTTSITWEAPTPVTQNTFLSRCN